MIFGGTKLMEQLLLGVLLLVSCVSYGESALTSGSGSPLIPLITEDPIDQTVDLQSNVSFNCTYLTPDVNATVEITWSGPNNVNVSNTRVIDGGNGCFTSVLTLTSVTTQHAGRYSCEATENATVTFSTNATLTVSYISVMFTMMSYNVSETDGSVTVMVEGTVTGQPSRNGSVNVMSSDSSAENGMDYNMVNTELTFSNISTTQPVDVIVVNDNVVEGVESFMLSLSTVDPIIVVEVPNMTTINIQDDDTTVRFEQPSYTITEGDDTLSVCVVTDSTLDRAIKVVVEVNASSTAIDRVDYNVSGVGMNLTINAGETRVCVNVTTAIDMEEEDNETIDLVLSSNDPGVLVDSEQAVTTVFIENFDGPTVIMDPESLDNVTAGMNVNFMIVATGSGMLIYQWLKNESTISDGMKYVGTETDNLMVLNVDNDDEGMYSCIVSNAAGTSVSMEANLTVFDPPVIDDQPDNANTIEGGIITFTVVARSTSPVTYQWLFDGIEIENATDSTYRIDNVTQANYGVYVCRVTNEDATVLTDEAQLDPLPPPVITVPPSPAVLDSDDLPMDVMFSCTATSDLAPLEITWTMIADNSDVTRTLTGTPSPDNSTVVQSTLIVSVSNDTYNGRYICTATNNQGSTVASTFLSVITIEDVANQTVPLGLDATFSCFASGSDRINYTWTDSFPDIGSGDFQLDTVDRVSGEDTANLTIASVRSVDTLPGYRCTVSVDGIVAGSRVGYLEVLFFEIIEGPVNQTILNGSTVTLNCTAQNVPNSLPLQFAWSTFYLNDSLAGLENTTYLTINEPVALPNNTYFSQLIIEDIQPDNAGTYYCRPFVAPDLILEVGHVGAVVTVEFPPIIRFTDNSGDTIEDGRFIANVGDADSLIKCFIDAVPSITMGKLVRVSPDGMNETVNTTSNSEMTRSVSLTLSEPSPTLELNGTTFVCTAVNEIGNTTGMIDLVVRDVPDSVNHNNTVSTPVSLFSVFVTWDTPNDNNDPITSYIVTLISFDGNQRLLNGIDVTINGGQFDISGGRTRFNATGLTPGNDYSITVRAVNSLGAVDESAAETFTFPSATPAESQPVDFNITTLSENGSIFSWMLPRLARTPDVGVVQFEIRVDRVGTGTVSSVNVSFNSGQILQGAGVVGLEAGTMYNASLIAVYTSPEFASPAIMTTFTTLTSIEAQQPQLMDASGSSVRNTTSELVISWPEPPQDQQDFLVGYRVSYTVASVNARRRRRQADMPTVSDVTETMLNIDNPAAYSTYTFDVSSRYLPPGSTDEVLRRLLNPFDIISAEGNPNAPTSLTADDTTISSISFSWTAPSMFNGVFHDYETKLMRAGDSSSTRTQFRTNTRDEFLGLQLNTNYTISVRARTNRGNNNGETTSINVTTSFGVVQPVISSVEASGTTLIVRINSFSTEDGTLSHYYVVISPSLLTSGQTEAIATSALRPSGMNNAEYYVAIAERTRTGSFSIIIGSGTSRTFRNVNYPNPPLEQGTQYYVFVRLFSGINESVYRDSSVFTQQVPRPVDPALIIGPIAAFAIILLAVLVILIVVAIFMMRGPPKRRAYSPGQMDGLLDGKRKKKGHPIELRRTRLFSPTLNVGEENVFTSSGQPTTLICEASGTPAPEVTWTHNEEPLDKERFIQLADASLFINDTDMQDEGSYLVKATNSAGTVEQLVRVTVIRPVPPEPDSEHPPIPVGEFTEKIALLRANDDEGLEDEYSDLELEWTFTSYAAKLNINKNKNRYVNIIPYDHARVVMALQDNTPGTDYINASYMDGYNKPNAYIATQGPIPSTFADFWRMIWELDSPTIVMVTNLKEEDKVKCHQYWPSYGTTTYGNIQVTLKNVENLAEYSIRTFNVTPLAGQSRQQMPVREVRQFHFLVWPDHGVPQYATALLSFRKRVINYHPDKRGPMVVHCSAGVGRTGTFITIDYIMKQIEAEGIIDIFNFVRHMRFRRNYMVQTSPQYVFIHDAILEAIMCGDSTIPTLELRDKIVAMLATNSDTGKNEFEQQFETLNAASPPDEDFDCSIAMVADNMTKNRSKEHLPPNDYRVVLSSENEQSDYICASFVDNYRQRGAFMVTQAPMESTTGDFWRMIWEHKSAAIVMLTDLEEDGKELCVKYWPSEEGEAALFGAYQVELSEAQKDRGDYITRRFKVSPVDKPQESRMVTQFHFTSWPKASVPTKPRAIIDLIDELQRVQRKSGNGPITVHCDDGISRTGAFCTLYSVLERVKIEQVVDVFQAVKHLRIQRCGLLSTVDQYIFIHKAVVEFLDTFSDYQNFK